MTILTKVEMNCETGVISEVPLTDDEIAQREADRVAFETEQARIQAEAEAKAAAKEAAHVKLAALGLTADEIAALS